jgi:hypothetical protein
LLHNENGKPLEKFFLEILDWFLTPFLIVLGFIAAYFVLKLTVFYLFPLLGEVSYFSFITRIIAELVIGNVLVFALFFGIMSFVINTLNFSNIYSKQSIIGTMAQNRQNANTSNAYAKSIFAPATIRQKLKRGVNRQ